MAPLSQDELRRESLAYDTINRSPNIVDEYNANATKEHTASKGSTFHKEQLPTLDQVACPNREHIPTAVEVINSDAFSVARNIMASDPARKVAVLNLASDLLPAGPWLQDMTTTQEDHYPWPNLGEGCVAGIYSPGVVIFRDDLDHECVELPLDGRRVVSVITVAAPRWSDLTPDQAFADPATLGDLREKIRLVYRMAAHNGQEYLVLGAMGCGALEMRDILFEPEFRGWFKKFVFVIYSRPTNGPGNFGIFEEVFQGVEV
ncbi:hypothetical protein DFH07DRAFT_866126 [Mycena maculata]|uniref:Microbial-type PARG catalytic domain-containing protein n=1 Tax=Mycena maculata TaxID=230809 RepID=A0AAD7NS61_9AGAR|nr:hypothetical protein DFH07DRAFT_866126 [Mycena maculata]